MPMGVPIMIVTDQDPIMKKVIAEVVTTIVRSVGVLISVECSISHPPCAKVERF